jgi:hypothetical protein
MIVQCIAEEAEDQALLAQAEAILADPTEVSVPWEEAQAMLRR